MPESPTGFLYVIAVGFVSDSHSFQVSGVAIDKIGRNLEVRIFDFGGKLAICQHRKSVNL